MLMQRSTDSFDVIDNEQQQTSHLDVNKVGTVKTQRRKASTDQLIRNESSDPGLLTDRKSEWNTITAQAQAQTVLQVRYDFLTGQRLTQRKVQIPLKPKREKSTYIKVYENKGSLGFARSRGIF